MTELFIDGHRIDIERTSIRQTFQNNVLGDVKTRQYNFTNGFKIYPTGGNERFFEYITEVNSQSDKPYTYMTGKIVEDGIEINTGTAIIRKVTEDEIELYIYSGINNLFEDISNLTLRDLDWSLLNHTVSFQEVLDSADGSKDYIYALCNQTSIFSNEGKIDYWLPSVYEHVIWDMIFAQSGYNYEGDIFATAEFKEVVINPTSFDETETDFLVRDFSTFMPEILQTNFIKEIIIRYGLVFEKKRNENTYVFKTIREVFKDRANAYDWSSKFAKTNEISFVLGDYAKKNWFRYKQQEEYNNFADGFFKIDTEHLQEQTTVYESIYDCIYQLNYQDLLEFEIFKFNDNGDVSIGNVNPSISKIEYIDTFYTLSDTLSNTQSVSGLIPHLRFKDLDWQSYMITRYKELEYIANKTKVVDCELYLDAIDLYGFSFMRLVYLKNYASYFYVNRISNFQSGKPTKCQLVRIPANVFSTDATAPVNTAPVVSISADMVTAKKGVDTVTFSITASDAENNIESWQIDFQDGPPQTGLGVPPATIQKVFSSTTGLKNVTITVTDFEGLVSSDTVQVTVEEAINISFDRSTGRYAAPSGTTVVFNLTCSGAGDASSYLHVSSTQGGAGNLASLTAKLNLSGTTNPQGVVVMPASGEVWLTGVHSTGPSGITTNGSSVQMTNNGITKSTSFNASNPLP